MQSFRIKLRQNLPTIGVTAIKFEAVRILFLSDVFVAVAVVIG